MADLSNFGGPEKQRPTRLLIIAVSALFVQQTFVAMSRLVLPVLAPLVAEDLGINPALIGAYSGVMSAMAMILAVGAGSLIDRYGAWRVCQAVLIITSAAFLVAVPGNLALFVLMALLIGPGPGVSTPASSHVLARHCPPKHAPFYFSIKQTGVPAGGLLAGIMAPFLAIQFGWRGAFVAIALMYVALSLFLQPFRARFDDSRDRTSHSFLADARSTMKLVVADASLREMVLTAFTFVGLQACFDSFFVIFLVKGHGFSLTAAGTVFAIAQGTAIGARILWGWVAGRFFSARRVLAVLGLVMAVASTIMGLSTPGWSVPALGTIAVLYAATAFSWNGVLLAEVARLSPVDRVGSTTGGVIVFIMGAAALYPIVFAAVLAVTENYGTGYIVAAIPALLVGIKLFRRIETMKHGKPVDGR